MAKAVLDELKAERPKRHFTVGIFDDVTSLSLAWDQDFRPPRPANEVQAVFFGLGSDGTVGANKNSAKIIVDATDDFVQGYFVYDSKKSGAMTASHLRFGPEPINSTYLISDADFVACHQFGLLNRVDILEVARDGATFLLNSPYGPDEVWDQLPGKVQRQLQDKHIQFWVVDANKVATEAQLGNRINTVMQPCFFALSGILPADKAVAEIKASVTKAYGKRGHTIVDRNFAAIDAALANLVRGRDPRGDCRRRLDRRRCPRIGPGVRQARDLDAHGRQGRPVAGVRPAGGRPLPVRDDPLREARHRIGDADLGPGHLHRLRQVHDRLPACGHPHEGLHSRRARRGS